ncbi:hypothetical protein FQN49_007519 [Arthroderma sp. PD_2]|nr:hypothetical protein FQN49_007519 [Arthroderma sp. PD_2]
MTTPTLINLPPPPSDPLTPSDMGPSTPNSGTTSLSALSTVAIKDGHQGARRPHTHRPHRSASNASETSTTTLDAERADRISRLAGLERLSARTASGGSGNPLHPHHHSGLSHGQEYFDSHPHMLKERSTVGSASATESMSRGSLGGRTRTTWASGSDDVYGHDEPIGGEDVDADDADARSTDAFSDEGNASLVGFGEGANSTVSGPISTAVQRVAAAGLSRQSSSMTGVSTTAVTNSSPTSSRFSHPITYQHQSQQPPQSPTGSHTPGPRAAGVDAQMLDGMTYDEDVVDTTARSPLPVHKNEDGQ